MSELASRLDAGEKPVMSYSWKDFYSITDSQKLHQTRLNDIRELALSEHDVIIGYGNNAIVVCHDRHHNRYRRNAD